MTERDRSVRLVSLVPAGVSARDLAALVESARQQDEDGWRLVVVPADDAAAAALTDVLDDRVQVLRPTDGSKRAGLAAALEGATEEFVALVPPDVRLRPGALAALRRTLEDDVDMAYGDDASADGAEQVRRPCWSPVRLRSSCYLGGLVAVRATLLHVVGGLRDEVAGAEEHDLWLRVGERARRVVHVGAALCTPAPGREPVLGDEPRDPQGWEAGRRAVQEHLDRVSPGDWAALGPVPGTFRLVRRGLTGTKVSVVIPTRGGTGLIWGQPRCFVAEAVASVLAKGGVDDVEVVVVYDRPATPETVLDELRRLAGDRLVLVPFEGVFNFSAKCNLGFLGASGDVVVFLNDDVEGRSDGFLADLVAPLRDPEVGMTGALLLYADGTVQHAGHVHANTTMYHAYLGEVVGAPGSPTDLYVDRECAGVTAACAAMRREVYEDVGGMCEALPINFNDVDLCLKVRYLGYRIVWLADVEAYHFESRTRVPVVHQWEVDLITGRWLIEGDDPYLPAGAS